MAHTPPVFRSLLAGVLAGIVAGIVTTMLAFIIEQIFGLELVRLRAPGLFLVSIVTNVIGGAVYPFLAARSSDPAKAYLKLTMAVAVALSLLVLVFPPYPGAFRIVALPLHFVVAIISAQLVPLLASSRIVPPSSVKDVVSEYEDKK